MGEGAGGDSGRPCVLNPCWNPGRGPSFQRTRIYKGGPQLLRLGVPISVIANSIPIWNFNFPESDLPALFFQNIKAGGESGGSAMKNSSAAHPFLSDEVVNYQKTKNALAFS